MCAQLIDRLSCVGWRVLRAASDHDPSQPYMQLFSKHAVQMDADPAVVVDFAHKSTASAVDRPKHVTHARRMPVEYCKDGLTHCKTHMRLEQNDPSQQLKVHAHRAESTPDLRIIAMH